MSLPQPGPAADAAEAPPPVDLRRSLRYVFLAWGFFGSAWFFCVNGAPLTRLAKQLHLSEFGFGLLAALPWAAALIQLPASLFLERFGHHKPLFIISGAIHRAVWLGMALVPWVLPAAWQSRAMLLLVFLSAALNHIATPVWVTWMANLVPRQIRGRFFSRRSQMGQLVGIVVTVSLGLVMDWAARHGDRRLLEVLTVAMGLGGLVGVLDFLLFLPVPAPGLGTRNPGVGIWQLIRHPLSDPNFRRLLGFSATLTFGTGFVGQFLWLHAFDVIGLSNTQATLMIMMGPMVMALFATRFWGRIIDRLGRKPVLIICSSLVIPGSVVWIFITKEHWVPGYLGVLVATFAWTGIDLSLFNLMLGMTESLQGRRYGSAYVAINSVIVAVAGFLSGIFGGSVASWVGDWRGQLFGLWPFTYHGVLFCVSGMLRAAALLWLPRLEDKGAYRTRDSLRHVGLSLVSSVQDMVILPGRLVRRVGRWTYKLRP